MLIFGCCGSRLACTVCNQLRSRATILLVVLGSTSWLCKLGTSFFCISTVDRISQKINQGHCIESRGVLTRDVLSRTIGLLLCIFVHPGIAGPYVFFEYQPEGIEAMLAELSPSNLNVYVKAKELEVWGLGWATGGQRGKSNLGSGKTTRQAWAGGCGQHDKPVPNHQPTLTPPG